MDRRTRWWLVLAVGVLAAALADPAVEALSNAGFFGRAPLTDGSNVDVLPALIVGLCIGLGAFTGLVRLQLRHRRPAPRDALIPLALRAFIVQLGVLYAMESAEQLVVCHRMLGGAIWLGGPWAVSLSIHALVAVAVTAALSSVLQRCARRTIAVIRLIRAILERRERDLVLTLGRCIAPARRARRFPALGPGGNRAPPVTFA